MPSRKKHGPASAAPGSLDRRADANAAMEKRYFSGRSSKDAASVRKTGASGARSLEHGELQRAAPNRVRHGD